MNYKKRNTFLFTAILFPSLCIAQNKGCIDSISFNKFYPSYFKTNFHVSSEYNNKPKRDVFNNTYLGGVTSFNSNSSYSSIIKFNLNNEILWYKNYKYDFVSSFVRFGDLVSIDEKADLLFFGGFTNSFNNISWPQIIKLDSSGSFKWGKVLKRSDDPNIEIGISMPYSNMSNEVFCTAFYNNDPTKIGLISIDGLGNVIWSKNYNNNTLSKFHFLGNLVVSQNSTVLILCIQFYYNSDDPANPNAIHGIQMMKINKVDGSIIQQNSFGYYKDESFSVPYIGILRKINYNPASGLFLIDNYGELLGPYSGLRHNYTTVDTDLNPVKTVWYKSLLSPTGGPASNGERTNIDEHNTITLGYTFTNLFSAPETFSYTAIDENLELITQKKINLTNLGFPNEGFVSDIAYKKNGVLNFQLVTTKDLGTNYIYLYDNSPYFNTTSICAGIDTPTYVKTPMYFKSLPNVTIEEAGSVPIETVSITMPPPINLPLPKEVICKAVSICDTIKLSGTQFHCLSSPLDSFKIFRNPLCVRKTNWQVDTAYIKILSSTDTSLYVQYLRPYRGSIKVGFGGCSLTDSIPIEVYAPQPGVNLGNDTLHCPGKTITLRAGKNFRTYLWQDGSSSDSLVAAQPGIYNVIATDSCGNVFKDTLTVNPFDGVLQVDYPQELCKNDVAVITLPANLINYTWQPVTNSSLSNYTWKLYPLSTTIYTITGERVPGCTLSDTVLVNVKNCPRYVYFPSAFTPNNDGLNDMYKPSVAGNIVFYQLTIYNRYGQTVFTSSSPNEGWNGHFNKSSKPLPGSYVWFCRYKFFNRPEQQEKGTFILIR